MKNPVICFFLTLTGNEANVSAPDPPEGVTVRLLKGGVFFGHACPGADHRNVSLSVYAQCSNDTQIIELNTTTNVINGEYVNYVGKFEIYHINSDDPTLTQMVAFITFSKAVQPEMVSFDVSAEYLRLPEISSKNF